MTDSQYYVTESEISRLFAGTGLPLQFVNQFTRDYVAVKRDGQETSDDLEALAVRVDGAEADILGLDSRLTTAEGSIVTITLNLSNLTIDYNAHKAAQVAHGSTGDIVGTGDYCTAGLGGTVKLAAVVADSTASAVNVVLNSNAAGVAYLQADAATWVAAINEHKAAINQLTTDLNALIALFNSSLGTERTALQRAV